MENLNDINIEEIKKYKLRELKNISNIPDEYWKYSLSDYDYTLQGKEDPYKKNAYIKIIKYISEIENNFKNGIGIYLSGKRYSRCGISLLGTFVLRSAIEHLYKSYYIEFPSFLLNIANYDSDISLYYDIDYLMFDSIDSEKSIKTNRIHDVLSDIISYRRSNKKPTIFCSYQNADLFSNNYCQSLLSYIQNYCIDIETVESNEYQLKTIAEYIAILREHKQYLDDDSIKYSPSQIYQILRG